MPLRYISATPICEVRLPLRLIQQIFAAKSPTRRGHPSGPMESVMVESKSMANEMICPDCGGVVGASETTAAGPPCTCFTNPAATETAVDVPSPKEKICALCGKDVSGHRRVKDSRGYIC